MKKYNLINNVIGFAIFIIASIVYISTAEPTASWWDCGEYIATAYKLEVGHPPGAPTFQLIGRIFSFFAGGDVTKVAFMINVVSAISSSLTILFLFWSITLLGKKIAQKAGEMTSSRMWAVFASGIVGALAYTFSDTFWFSAVEGEVYAMSSFFTAIVFWAILKWEEQADQPHSLRWLILISFLIGLAIGVHLLNLLAIPAIVYVYYFKRYKKITTKGMLIAGGFSILLLAVILFGIIPGIVALAGGFEVFFVNSLSLPFNSGTIFFFLLLISGLVFGIIWSTKKGKPVLNASLLAFVFLLIGYTTFFSLIIRSNANTPINENAPKDAVSLRAYLGREQYGSTPLFYGNYYTAGRPVDIKDGYTKYIKGDHKYIAASKSQEYIYDDSDCTIFPRMYSNVESKKHVPFYKLWTGIKSDRQPTFGENLKFFFRYQVNFMYLRYFMWNFVGRQNDVQSHYFNERNGTRDYIHGNWISGIGFIDNLRLGPQEELPDHLKNNAAKNTFFFLPFILGICGFLYQYKKAKKDAFIVFLMFVMTGIAIVLYLNQPPLQPRERDYAYAGSFYAFAFWIGLGVMGLTEWLSKKIPYKTSLIAVSVVAFLGVPVLMAQQGWNDHDRSKKYAARDFAHNYLSGCEKNAILITYGDNDTFPLWYVQEVENDRTDVRVLNYTLSGMHWYVEQLYNTLYDSPKIDFTLPKEFYGLGKDGCYVQARTNEYVELTELLQLMKEGNPMFKGTSMRGEEVSIFPANKFKITLDKPNLIKKGILTEEIAQQIPDEIRWEIKKEFLYRHELMFLDLLATNKFERPIYLMHPSHIRDIFPSAYDFSQQEGTVYRLLPYTPDTPYDLEKTYAIFKNSDIKWGNLNHPGVYVDPVSLSQAEGQRLSYMWLAETLISKDMKTEAKEILDLGLKFFPNERIPYNTNIIQYAKSYLDLGEKTKGEEILIQAADFIEQYLNFYSKIRRKDPASSQANSAEYARYIQLLNNLANQYQLEKLDQKVKFIASTYTSIAL